MPPRRRESRRCCALPARPRNWTRSLTIGDSPLAQLHVVVRVDPAEPPAHRRRAARARDRRRAGVLARSAAQRAARAASAKHRRCALERRYASAFPGLLSPGRRCRSWRCDDIVDLEGIDSAPEQNAAAPLPSAAAAAAAGASAHHSPRRGAVGVRGAADLRALRSARDCRASLPARAGRMAAAAWIQDFELEHYDAAARRSCRASPTS